MKRFRLWLARWLFSGIFPDPASFEPLGLDWQRQLSEWKNETNGALGECGSKIAELEKEVSEIKESLKRRDLAPRVRRKGSFTQFREAVQSGLASTGTEGEQR